MGLNANICSIFPFPKYPVFHGYKIARKCICSEEGHELVSLFYRLAIQKLYRHKYSNKFHPVTMES